MTILVTGGAGYIGSHCVRQLLKRGESVVVLDNLSTGYKRFILTERFIEGDIRDKALVVQLLKEHQIDTVMHFAASCYVGESFEVPEQYYENNVFGTLQLLSAMQEAGVQNFIFSSSCTVYGPAKTLPITEEHPLKPMSPYGATKRLVETMLENFSKSGSMRYVSFRYFNAAGADPIEGASAGSRLNEAGSNVPLGECHDPEPHLIPLVLQVASGRKNYVTVHGDNYDTPDGTCIRDFVHVNDIVQAHLLGLDYLRDGGASDIFNIGNERGYSVKEVIEACQKITGQEILVMQGPPREGDPAELVASAEKLREKLKWSPNFSTLESILETAWQWERQEASRHAVSDPTNTK